MLVQDKHAIVLAFPRGHVETWRWNLQNEDLEPVADNDERERLVYAVRSNSFDRELGQYPEDANEGWPRVSYLITPATVQRMGLGGGVRTSSSAEQTTFDRYTDVDVCGCMWMYADLCGCMWIYVDVCGCMWMYVDLCGCMQIYADLCGCMWMYVDSLVPFLDAQTHLLAGNTCAMLP